ncbi:hypothetical protein BC351_22235 [Paenibacillus ferrarius]|uniref:Lipoprotein n=1 Tax=Paenibacillus ferrarius TaxID=1469647 RepID=A0A1V4HNI6_9BACL|nr:hypothetical protein [Paenibacillus ferrarius]OPH59048.1 hypothetical protein BC351_22235 [Paenibacillus ferrarius]
MNRKMMICCVVLLLASLMAGCGGKNEKAAAGPQAEAITDALLGAKLSYFDSKFGAGVKKEDNPIVSYMDGKLKVTENQGYAYNIFNPYVDRGETTSPEEALAFIKQFLPTDAVQIKDEEDKTTKIRTLTFTSKALKAQTGLAGQLTIIIFKDPANDAKVRQAQISIDITANM